MSVNSCRLAINMRWCLTQILWCGEPAPVAHHKVHICVRMSTPIKSWGTLRAWAMKERNFIPPISQMFIKTLEGPCLVSSNKEYVALFLSECAQICNEYLLWMSKICYITILHSRCPRECVNVISVNISCIFEHITLTTKCAFTSFQNEVR